MPNEFNYFRSFYVDGYSYSLAPQADFGFNAQGISLLNRGSRTVYYSFDGLSDHGDLNPSDASKGMIWDSRPECQIWLRAYDGYSTIRVEAWAGA